MDTSSESWEIFAIYASKSESFLMIPQNHTENILILGTSYETFGNESLNSFMIDPKKMTEEEKSSYPSF